MSRKTEIKFVDEKTLLRETFGEHAALMPSEKVKALRDAGKLSFHRLGNRVLFDLNIARGELLEATRNAPRGGVGRQRQAPEVPGDWFPAVG